MGHTRVSQALSHRMRAFLHCCISFAVLLTVQGKSAIKAEGKYPYDEVLAKSLLFFEAQRSGPLPDDNRVPWRDDSAMNDEVLGGYYDAGDLVKFGFPMASTISIIAWGGFNFLAGYEAAGQKNWLSKCIKWGSDYFIGCHTAEYELIGQIGDGYDDHAYWGRPEDMTMARPAFRITSSQPGSDL